jgi:sugar/nucleoside kinase (ribokinase family)
VTDDEKPTLDDLRATAEERLRFTLAGQFPDDVVDAGTAALRRAHLCDLTINSEGVVRSILAAAKAAELAKNPPSFEFREPIRITEVNGSPLDDPQPWWKFLGMLDFNFSMSEVVFEGLVDAAYLHAPDCPRLVGRDCGWCESDGKALADERARRQKEFRKLIITSVV